MLKIGDFSVLSKVSIKALRYYEAEKIFMPSYVDQDTNYRYYDYQKLKEISEIVFLRKLGLSIKAIKEIKKTGNLKKYLLERKTQIIKEIDLLHFQLSKINDYMEEKSMNYDVKIKYVNKCVVFYGEGVIDGFEQINDFIVNVSNLARALNPNMINPNPNYCFISYLDGKPTDKKIRVRYNEAVNNKGIENEEIKFEVLDETKVVSLMVQGSYDKLPKAYEYLLNYIDTHCLEMISLPRECYIDGAWNKENECDYLTEIQIPIK